MKEIIYYKQINGTCPYLDWYNTLDKSIQIIIDRRIDHIRYGTLGHYRRFDGLTEIKLTQGSGYRIYCYEVNDIVIVFLSAGDKNRQSKDIEKAKIYLKEFKERYN
jgi:putative addiction module killer protein